MSLSDDESVKTAGRTRIGERLQQDFEAVIARYVDRMRSDPQIPQAKSLPAAVLEDHAVSFLGDLFQTLVILEKADQLKERDESELLNDGSAIQRLIADLHGRQRRRNAWSEEALEREYQILNEEIESLVRHHTHDTADSDGLTWALDVLKRHLARARDASFVGHRAAAGAS
ncbi:MAG: hypothetical protein ACJ8AC_06290 [Gemmatimonadaceae bacterium]